MAVSMRRSRCLGLLGIENPFEVVAFLPGGKLNVDRALGLLLRAAIRSAGIGSFGLGFVDVRDFFTPAAFCFIAYLRQRLSSASVGKSLRLVILPHSPRPCSLLPAHDSFS